ncbi:winged helix-turn-helix transcriptional regulator [Pantoea stewartii]|uniref:winged helix-turn-helix transcriptional regulator n=1 Tax=Pantoea stewartii TaxID=66269 RepID=UPI0006CFE690|nr:helix-turn-helix domain-containing protein [Pantoea stewartii]
MSVSSPNTFSYEQPCPIRDVLDRIGDKWSLLILEALAERTLRFNELHRHIGDVARQVLSRTLKRLEVDGYILRTLYPEVPPRVEYSLTELGRSFLKPMQQLIAWADDNHQAICLSRQRTREQDKA